MEYITVIFHAILIVIAIVAIVKIFIKFNEKPT